MTPKKIRDKIKHAVNELTSNIQDLNDRQEIIAINFGVQRVFDGFELYLTGHSWYDGDDDLWLLDNEWTPEKNYISLGQGSLEFDRLEILDIYERIVQDDIISAKGNYEKLVVVVGLADRDPKRLK